MMRPSGWSWRGLVGDDGYFPIASHHVVLGLLLAAVLTAQTVLSLNAVRPDELIDQQLLANESDTNSVVAVQRESFNVALALADWGHGAATARDVQVSRALLGQRLSVVTQSRTLTAANVGSDYLRALAALDEVILGLGAVPDGDAVYVLEEADPVVQAFLTETRALTEIFQRLGRRQVEGLVEVNRDRQRVQTVLQVAIVLLLGLLSLSMVVALGRGHRRVAADLAAQERRVEQARHHLELVRELDAGIGPLLQAVHSGTPSKVVRAGLKGMLDAMPTGCGWDVPDDPDGQVTPELVHLPGTIPVVGADDLTLVTARAQSVIEALRRREGAAQAAELARRHDPLTGLVNRLGFLEALERLLEVRPGLPVSVCILGIDRFGEVSGSLGFSGADRVLVELAGRLRSAAARVPGSVVAHVAADEFAVVVPLATAHEATAMVDELRAAATYLSDAAGIEVAVSVSVGEAIGVSGRIDAQELLRRCALAMLLAKETSDRRGRVRFDPAAHEHLASALAEELAVRNALRSGEYRVHFQPIVDLPTGRTIGLEALSRWDRPGVGLVAPGVFLPVIERSGLSTEFGSEVIVETMRAWKRSLRAALVEVTGPSAYVSVNVDAVQLADGGFEAFVLSALDRSAMEPRELVLELTEHAAIDGAHTPMLGRLRAAGVRIAIDDFGSGYSSLGRSTALPADILKLDRAFVAGLLASGHDPELFADLARLANTLGMALIAEGIETREVADLLLSAGITGGQGFFFSPALPEREAVRWVVDRSRMATGDSTSVRRAMRSMASGVRANDV